MMIQTDLNKYLKETETETEQLTLKEIAHATRQLNPDALKFFYNTVYGENGFFNYIEDKETITEQLKDELNIDYKEYFNNTEYNRKYFVWINGAARSLNEKELKQFIYTKINLTTLKYIESTTHDGLKWINEVLKDSLTYF